MKNNTNFIKRTIKTILTNTPLINKKFKILYHIIESCGFLPGDYYSPIPDLKEIKENSNNIFNYKSPLNIDLNTDNQVKLLEELKQFYSSYPYNSDKMKQENFRYNNKNGFYKYSDAVFLFCMIRNFKPKRIIEVGSGYSSALMLDTNELFFDNKVHHTFIEPYPEERLMKILTESDISRNKVIKEKVQNVKTDIFQTLDKNDILFIDSSHVSKVGSDVNYLIFEVLPSLKPGVIIHVHDVFYPFELPEHWIMNHKRFWNESYLLHAFLMYNNNYEIINFNTYLQKIKTDWFRNEMPECLIGSDDTGSIWIRKLV